MVRLTARGSARARAIKLNPENPDPLRTKHITRPADHTTKRHDSKQSARRTRTNRAEARQHERKSSHPEIRLAFLQLTQPRDREGRARTAKSERGENQQSNVDHN